MIYSILVELDIRADSEREVRDRVEDFLFSTMRVDLELGIINWEIRSVQSTPEDSS